MAHSRTTSFVRLVLVAAVFAVMLHFWGNVDVVEEATARVRFAGDHDFLVGEGGLQALQELYGFEFDHVYDLVVGFTHEALAAEDVDAALGWATDGKIVQLELIRLDDDLHFFPSYYAAPVIRKEILIQYPEIPGILAPISRALDTNTMAHLNYLVTIEEQEKASIAEQWLRKNGLLPETPQSDLEGPDIKVGVNTFSEHQILGQILIAALEAHGIPVADHTPPRLFGLAREAILNAEIDLYWECSGTQWEMTPTGELDLLDGRAAYEAAAEHDREVGLIWLEPAAFENSRAILMRKQQAKELGIASIHDLARWARQTQITEP